MDNALPVQWVKNSHNGEYFDLLRLDLNGSYFNDKHGVYLIWYTAPAKAQVIRVGQGNIGEKLKLHRSDPQVMQYGPYGQLKVTWAIIDVHFFDGVEAFLYDNYKPLLGERALSVQPIPVTPLI